MSQPNSLDDLPTLEELGGPRMTGTEYERRIAQLEATLDDISRGSTHELVRYWIEKTVAIEARVQRAAALAQAWRDRAFKSKYMSNAESDALMDCAEQLDKALR